jgi:hypothetical protein
MLRRSGFANDKRSYMCNRSPVDCNKVYSPYINFNELKDSNFIHGGWILNHNLTVSSSQILELYDGQYLDMNNFTLTIYGNCTIGGSIYNADVIVNKATMNILSTGQIAIPRTFINDSIIYNRGFIFGQTNGVIQNNGQINNNGKFQMNPNSVFTNDGPFTNHSTILNEGTIHDNSTIDNFADFFNSGVIYNRGTIYTSGNFENNGYIFVF